jgi:anti-anti-sigma factor
VRAPRPHTRAVNTARSLEQPGPPDQAPGHIWVDDDPTVLRMSGDIDLVVVGDFARAMGAPEPTAGSVAPLLCDVGLVDMTRVTFADSSTVGLIASLIVLCRDRDARLRVRGLSPLVETTLEVTGVLDALDIES